MKLYEWIVLSILFAKSRPFPYFQFDDMFHVECIPTVHLKDYVYYGNVSTYINGSLLMTSIPISVTKSSSSSSLLGQCEIWKHVMSSMTRWAVNNNVTNYWTYPDEFVNHNNCRNFDLTRINDNSHYHLAIHMKIIKPNSSPVGPWCYAYDHVHKIYYVARCFPECVGNDYQDTTKLPSRFKIFATADTKPNYNAELIDWITEKAFNKYEWGPSTYYDSLCY
ncbi:E3 ubiquitin-protein ligase [Dirofilaria immitis]